uniref:BrnT family toxin n=1 Tax=Chlorobium chlorochromatii (strain CaD3) TaxID=340177 RepID=Q3ARL0_CHLCH
MKSVRFEWDEEKNKANQKKHQVSFALAQHAFLDPKRIIAEDIKHSNEENRFYCVGRVNEEIMTVRFTYRGNVIRIFGAGYWRKGRKIYEEQHQLYR